MVINIKKIKYVTLFLLYLGVFLFVAFIIPIKRPYNEIKDSESIINEQDNILKEYESVCNKIIPFIVKAKVEVDGKVYQGEVIEDKGNGQRYCLKIDDGLYWYDSYYVTILDIKEEKIDYLTDNEIELYINLSKFTSDTNYFIYVDIFRNQTYVLKKINNYFYLEKRLNCSTGELTTPTKRGTYKIVNKGKSFIGRSKDYICYNYLTYSGSYLLHSFPYSLDNKVLDDRVNDRVSNGCVRFSLLDSKYLYDVITIGTTICLY